jgi:hypothetical protein
MSFQLCYTYISSTYDFHPYISCCFWGSWWKLGRSMSSSKMLPRICFLFNEFASRNWKGKKNLANHFPFVLTDRWWWHRSLDFMYVQASSRAAFSLQLKSQHYIKGFVVWHMRRLAKLCTYHSPLICSHCHRAIIVHFLYSSLPFLTFGVFVSCVFTYFQRGFDRFPRCGFFLLHNTDGKSLCSPVH